MPHDIVFNGILACICETYRYIAESFKQLIATLEAVNFDRNILVLFSTVLAGFISITVPVALSIVARHTEEYKDKEISESFLHEPTYVYQVIAVPIFVVYALILFGLEVTKGLAVYIVIVLDILSFFVFIAFLFKVGQYAANFDDYYSNRLKKEADAIIQKKK